MSKLPLMERFASIPDPRKRRGRVHPLPAILSLCTVAVLAGMKSLEAIAPFGRDHGKHLAFALGFTRGRTPAKSTLSEVLRAIDVDAFEAAPLAWAQGRDGGGPVAIDGEALRGSRDGGTPGVHLLAAFAPGCAAVLGQVRVGGKTNEHKAALVLLGVLPLEGRVVTGDAMFTHRDVAEAIRGAGGDYILIVKDNQPELKAQISSALCGDGDFSPLPA